jgi:hypothetical protein
VRISLTVRCLLILLAVVLAAGLSPVERGQADEKVAGAEGAARSFLATHCISCHGEKAAKGDLRLDTLAANFKDRKTVETWTRVYDRVRNGEMPPRKRPQPKAEEKKVLLDWLAQETRGAARPFIARRLNRYEYEYTLRELFQMPGLEVKELLPKDGETEGFDTVGQALDISHVQMARYLEAADMVLDQIIAQSMQPLRPETRTRRYWPQDEPDWINRMGSAYAVPLSVHGVDPCWDPKTYSVPRTVDTRKIPRCRAVGTTCHSDPAGLLTFRGEHHRLVPQAGLYKVTISAYAFDWDRDNKTNQVQSAKAQRPFSLGTATRTFGYWDAPKDKAAVHSVTTWLEPNDVLYFNAVSLDHGLGVKNHMPGGTLPGVAVEWLDVEGPIFSQWPTHARQILFGGLPLAEWHSGMKTTRPPRGRDHGTIYTPISAAPVDDAKRLMHGFMRRAYRRHVHDPELQRILKLVKDRLDEGATFEEAMRVGYKAVLCSPHFLFLRREEARNDGYALASRLSYFLWSSPPDSELEKLGDNRELLKPEVLRAQTERLLKDPKSQRFIESFTGQWLKLRDINATQPDQQLYPEREYESDIIPYLIDSMVDETRTYVTRMIQDDLSVSYLVDSDFAMLNEPLAKHYGIKDVEGAAIREVKLPPRSHRGGILTQGSILKVSANGTTTSPVLRGAWVTARLLGRPVPPPPPNVPGLDPDVRGATTIRQQLEKHRSVEACATCHANMDPFGFALENFDVMGTWRERYRILRDKRMDRNGPLVDSAGETVEGKAFKDVDGLKTILLADLDPLARNLTGKLMVYGTGAALSPADHAEVDEIVARLRDRKHGLRSIIHEVVQSRAFRE